MVQGPHFPSIVKAICLYDVKVKHSASYNKLSCPCFMSVHLVLFPTYLIVTQLTTVLIMNTILT